MEKRIRDKADQWLALRESGKGIRESFGETGMAYVQWLLIPGSPESGEIPDELVNRWNTLLLQVFTRTDRYRKPEEELWEDLRRLLQDWDTWEETENDVSQIFLENWAVPRTPHFVGREEELARMRECLSEVKILILFGMAGMGKSSLAKEYASRFQRAYDRAVLLPCERGIRDALADDSILPVRGLCYVPQGKRGELGWYCRKKLNRLREIITERTLLILDNLDDLEDSYFSRICQLPCRILVTTRMKPETPGIPAMEVGALKEQEELWESLAERTLKPEEKECLRKLSGLFGDNTLLIRRVSRRMLEYQGDLEAFQQEISQMTDLDDLFHLRELGVTEQQVMREASLLPLFGISMQEFQRYSSRASLGTLQKLERKGLLEYDGKRGWLSLHPLIRSHVRTVLGVDCKSLGSYLHAFAREMKDYWNFPREQKSHCRQYILALLKALPIETQGLEDLFVLADFLWQMGEWETAEQYVRRLYAFTREKKGESHRYTAWAANLAASVYYNQHRYVEASHWHRKAWEAYRDCQEKEPFYEALYLAKYSRCLWWEGERKEATACLKRAEGIYLTAIAEEPKIRRNKSFLVNLYIEQTRRCLEVKEYDQGLQWCRKAEHLCETIGAGEATRAFVCHDAARLLRGKGERERSSAYLEKALIYAEHSMESGDGERRAIQRDWKSWEKQE